MRRDMRRFFVIVLVTLSFGLPALGHGEEKTGILVDAKCGANLVEKEASKAASPARRPHEPRKPHGFSGSRASLI